MARFLLTLVLAVLMAAPSARAQDQNVWVQIDTQPSLKLAQESIRRYSVQVLDVNGFSMGGGWYAVALGPYGQQDAELVLRNFTASGVIPQGSFLTSNTGYHAQFWPVGADVTTQPDVVAAPEIVIEEPVQVLQATLTETPDETKQEARASENQLTREQKLTLQEELQWAGFYNGAIDAAFGRGTRASMAAWQEANGYEPTGIMTTRQRAELHRQFNAILDGLGLQTVRDTGAGIEMMLPTGVVTFDKYEPPFAHYNPSGAANARVLLISQEGDATTLAGLYDIMQTLEIVPETGPRELSADAFTLTGEGGGIVSHTEARLVDGQIKGFTLVWKSNDEERRSRLLTEMQASFARLDGVLDPAAGAGEEQSIDLVSGLEIRRPRLSRSGFYVDGAGTVVTTTEVIAQCRKLTIDEVYEAEIAAQDASAGIAVLRPVASLAPMAVAAFQQNVPRLQSDVAVAGYSYGGTLGAPTLTFGQLADLKGLNGEANLKRLELAALDGDAGGPVVDAGGAVLGMLLPAGASGRQLPDGVSFAADAGTISTLLSEAGITPAATSETSRVKAEALTRQASDFTALVSCWD